MATSYESFDQKFKVALIQLHPKPLDPEYNFGQASNYIREAASQGASLAVLPEYHLSSWTPDDERFAQIALTAYEYVPRYQALAQECKINIVPGTIVTVDPKSPSPTASNGTTGAGVKPPTLLNIAPFISYTGELLGSYTKANLWIPERTVLTSGPDSVQASQPEHHHLSTEEGPPPQMSPHSVIETPLGPIGIIICWDLAFPEACRALVRQGARLIIIPTFWTRDDLTPEARAYGPDVDIQFLTSALITRSFENTCAVVFCNVGGPKEEGYAGLSQVVLPLVGKVKGSFDDGEPGMRIVECDMRTVDVAEENYKIREDLAGKNWHYGYSHEK
ncbi:carbon-nitrogen family hydrolase [Cladophialophora carrionii]|uniref:Carbon-nitrogen family hydrolase n=1 Tax=Cladophialophora carrionii TaxID=86049 RepID=A0A1C1CRA2_9EURO|nr:carbon-nitrogen family hydrolase [Cladophialophora carrionii]